MTTYTEIELDRFKIIGIWVRTTNQNGQSQQDISQLWARLMSQSMENEIPNKETEDIYCIYCDYETDHTGPYTTILGCRVSSLYRIPEGFIGKTIPRTKYRVFKSIGKISDAVLRSWNSIYQTVLARKYESDFDVYGQKSQNPEEAVVETYLSIIG